MFHRTDLKVYLRQGWIRLGNVHHFPRIKKTFFASKTRRRLKDRRERERERPIKIKRDACMQAHVKKAITHISAHF